MANKRHLAKLREGVEAWNQWRKENPEIKPNLERANLYHLDLNRVNLEHANLKRSHLKKAKLIDANLSNTDLERANLRHADLSNANLHQSNLRHADLRDANLKNAILVLANFFSANLRKVNLMDSNLRDASFKQAKVLEAILEGSNLTGACIEDWNANSKTNLLNVKCDYIYLKKIYAEDQEKWFYRNRVPHDPDQIFAPGEFTKRYQKILETVNLYFGEGIDWQVFLNSFQKLQEEEKIKIADGEKEIPIVQGIENTGDGSFIIKIGVSPDTDKGEIEKSFWQKYQPMLKAAEERYQLQLNAKDEQITYFRQQNTQLLRIIEIQASQPINIHNKIDNQNVQGDNNMTGEQKGNFGIGHMSGGTISGNAKIAGVINEAAQQDLAQAAAEIQQLLDQLQQNNEVTPVEAQQQTAKELATQAQNDLTLKERLLKLGQFVSENAGKTVVSEGVKGVIKLLLFML